MSLLQHIDTSHCAVPKPGSLSSKHLKIFQFLQALRPKAENSYTRSKLPLVLPKLHIAKKFHLFRLQPSPLSHRRNMVSLE